MCLDEAFGEWGNGEKQVISTWHVPPQRAAGSDICGWWQHSGIRGEGHGGTSSSPLGGQTKSPAGPLWLLTQPGPNPGLVEMNTSGLSTEANRKPGRGPGSPWSPGPARPGQQLTSQAPLAKTDHPCLAVEVCFFFRKQPRQLSARSQNPESGQENGRSIYFCLCITPCVASG